MNDTQQVHYNALFSEIINKFSVIETSNFGKVFVKHLNYSEIGKIEAKYFEFLDDAKSKNILTYKEQESYILKEGFWKDSDENDILIQEKFLSDIKLTYSKEYLNSRRKQIKLSIDSAELKLSSLKLRKQSLMSQTAEDFANKKILNFKINHSIFSDSEFKEKIDTSNLDSSDYNNLIEMFYKNEEKFKNDNIKKLSLSSFFTNIFYLSNDNIFHFYGKPIIELTNYQVDLYMWGRYFKQVLSEYGNSIPKNVQNNPDELINWVELRKNAKDARVIDDEKGGCTTIVGAKKEDYEILGLQVTDNSRIKQKLKEKGGILTKEDLYKMEN